MDILQFLRHIICVFSASFALLLFSDIRNYLAEDRNHVRSRLLVEYRRKDAREYDGSYCRNGSVVSPTCHRAYIYQFEAIASLVTMIQLQLATIAFVTAKSCIQAVRPFVTDNGNICKSSFSVLNHRQLALESRNLCTTSFRHALQHNTDGHGYANISAQHSEPFKA